jgi:hypothetical protein
MRSKFFTVFRNYLSSFFPKLVNNRDEQRGVVLTETTLVLPLMVALIIGGHDMTRYLFSYMSLSHTVRELAHIGVNIRNIDGTKTNLAVSDTEYLDCFSKPQTLGSECGHKIIHYLGRKLIYAQPKFFEQNNVSLTTTYNSVSKEVRVDLRTEYSPFFIKFLNIGIRASETTVNDRVF